MCRDVTSPPRFPGALVTAAASVARLGFLVALSLLIGCADDSNPAAPEGDDGDSRRGQRFDGSGARRGLPTAMATTPISWSRWKRPPDSRPYRSGPGSWRMGRRARSNSLTTDSGEILGPFELRDAEQAYRFEIDVVTQTLRLEVVNSTGGNTGFVEFAAYGEQE